MDSFPLLLSIIKNTNTLLTIKQQHPFFTTTTHTLSHIRIYIIHSFATHIDISYNKYYLVTKFPQKILKMKFLTIISAALLSTVALAAPSPAKLEKRSTVSDIVRDVLGWCDSQGTLCDKVCSVGMSVLAGKAIPFAGGLIGPIWCASMRVAATCATDPAHPSCADIGEAILQQSIRNLGITQEQYEMIKREVDEMHERAKEAAEKAAREAKEAAEKAKELADKAAKEAKDAADKVKDWACGPFGC